MIRRTPKSPLTATRFPYPTLCRSAIFGGVTCGGKAALRLRGEAARVEGVVFQNMRVPDGNGAGIRLERRALDVVNAMFRGSEQGILTADAPQATLTLDSSTFSRVRGCAPGLISAHTRYTDNISRAAETRSRSDNGTRARSLK